MSVFALKPHCLSRRFSSAMVVTSLLDETLASTLLATESRLVQR